MREHVSMDVFEAVRTVLAVRSIPVAALIPEEVIARILESARLTASSMNAQPWHFVAVTEPETLHRLGEAVKTGRYVADAPLAVAVAVERASRFGVSDASRAVQSMVLTAWEEGVGSVWSRVGGDGRGAGDPRDSRHVRRHRRRPVRLPGRGSDRRQEGSQAAGGGPQPGTVRSAVLLSGTSLSSNPWVWGRHTGLAAAARRRWAGVRRGSARRRFVGFDCGSLTSPPAARPCPPPRCGDALATAD